MLDKDLEQLKAAALAALVETLKAKAPYLKGGAERAARLSARIATYLGLGPSEVQEIHDAGLLRDIGMISTREAVLQKRGPLTEQEHEHMRNHVIVGAEILQPLPHLGRTVEYVRHHHERLDGSGYPDELRGNEIPLGAQIIGVADAYCAITQERPYRPAFSPTAALRALRGGEGLWFDCQLLDALEWAVREAADDLGSQRMSAEPTKEESRP